MRKRTSAAGRPCRCVRSIKRIGAGEAVRYGWEYGRWTEPAQAGLQRGGNPGRVSRTGWKEARWRRSSRPHKRCNTRSCGCSGKRNQYRNRTRRRPIRPLHEDGLPSPGQHDGGPSSPRPRREDVPSLPSSPCSCAARVRKTPWRQRPCPGQAKRQSTARAEMS
jgi:hypothetical protein